MMTAKEKLINWSLFIALSVIWGSSFILMKAGMNTLSDFQVASIRIFSAGLVLTPVAFKKLASIPKKAAGWLLLSGLLGSFIPAYLFCIAETRIDSSLAGFLNAFTPIFAILIGIFFFHNKLGGKLPGVLTGFAGMALLFFAKDSSNGGHFGYSAMVILATLSYAFNANMVNRRLKEVGSVAIAATGLAMMAVPACCILAATGFFNADFGDKPLIMSLSASATLGVLGTAVATILFYMLLKRAGPLFASMVTYGIPFIALFWGLLAGEHVNALQIVGLIILLAGVYFASK